MEEFEPLTFLGIKKYKVNDNEVNELRDEFYKGNSSNPYQTSHFMPSGHFRAISKVIDLEKFDIQDEN